MRGHSLRPSRNGTHVQGLDYGADHAIQGECVDYDALRRLVEWQIDEGTHGLVPVGTTGESPTLTHDEHNRVVEIPIEARESGCR